MIGAHGRQRNRGAQLSGRIKPARSRGASQNDVPRRQQRAGEGEAKGDTACGRDGLGNRGAATGLYTTGVAGEGPGDGDVLHSVHTKKKAAS